MDGAFDHVRNMENGLMLYRLTQPKELTERIRQALDLEQKQW
jgi:hypothetical protein